MNPIEQKIFPNGVTCLALSTARKGPVNISVYFRGGRLFETESNSGITYLLLSSMLNETLSKFENASESMQVRVENHADFSGFSLNTTTQGFVSALQFLYQLITSPLA